MIYVSFVPDPWKASSREYRVVNVDTEVTAGDVLELLGEDRDAGRWSLIHDGKRVGFDHELCIHDAIVIGRLPSGFSFLVFVFFQALISFGVSLLIDALIGQPDQPQQPDPQGATYGFGGIRNTRTQGTQIPAPFGRHRVGGQILMQYRRNANATSTKEFLYMLVGIGIGQVRAIGDVTNDEGPALVSAGLFEDSFDDMSPADPLVDRAGWEQGPDEPSAPGPLEASNAGGIHVEDTILAQGLAQWVDTIGLEADNASVSFVTTDFTGARELGVAINAASWRNYHGLRATGSSNLRLYKVVDEVHTTIADIAGSLAGVRCTLQRDGDTLEVLKDGVSAGTWAADTALTSERVGISAPQDSGLNTFVIDDFEATTINRLPDGMHINGVEANSFRNVTVWPRMGRRRNASLPLHFRDVVQGYQVKLPTDASWTEYVFRRPVKGYHVVVEFPRGLFDQTSGLDNATVELEVEYRPNATDPWSSVPGSPFVFTHAKTVAFSRTIFQDDPDQVLSGTSQRIRFRRTSPPAGEGDPKVNDVAIVGSINEVEAHDKPQRYKDIALVGVRIEAQENLQGGTPVITNIIEGQAVPTWDGVTGGPTAPEIVYTYSTNPAWVALGMLLDPVHGFGVDLADVDIASWRTWAVWNDEQLEYAEAFDEPLFDTDNTEAVVVGATSVVVDDTGDAGQFADLDAVRIELERINQLVADPVNIGGSRWRLDLAFPVQGNYPAGWTLQKLELGPVVTDTRNTFNGVFDSEVSKWEALLRVCANGRAIPIKEGRTWRVRFQDVRSVSQVISDANIVRGSLEISYAGSGDTPDILEGQYLDEDQDWDQDVALASGFARNDPTVIPRRQTVTLYGKTKAREARREANYRLRAQKLLTKRLRFQATLDSLAVQSGDVLELGLTMPGWALWSGRCRGTTGAIRIDSRIELPTGLVTAIIRNGDDRDGVEHVITTAPGTYEAGDELLTDAATPVDLVADATVVLTTTTQKATKWDVTRVAIRDDLTAGVEAIQYDPDVYLLPGFGGEVIKEAPPDTECIEEGVYFIDIDEEALTCPLPPFCNPPPSPGDCCFEGTCGISFTGDGAACAEIIEIIGNRVIFRILPGCEGDQVCLVVQCDGTWQFYSCAGEPDGDGGIITCGDAGKFCVPALVSICDTTNQICWTICGSGFSSGFDGPGHT